MVWISLALITERPLGFGSKPHVQPTEIPEIIQNIGIDRISQNWLKKHRINKRTQHRCTAKFHVELSSWGLADTSVEKLRY